MNDGVTPKELSKQDDPTFKKWFGQSKVVDGRGRPIVVYHGTSSQISAFDASKSKHGFWFSGDYGDASDYGNEVIEAYLSLQNPVYFERTKDDKGVHEAIAQAKVDGFDGMIVTASEDGDENGFYWPTNYVVFDPEQIKFAITDRDSESFDDAATTGNRPRPSV